MPVSGVKDKIACRAQQVRSPLFFSFALLKYKFPGEKSGLYKEVSGSGVLFNVKLIYDFPTMASVHLDTHTSLSLGVHMLVSHTWMFRPR
ncbi:hypothetical protein SAMN05443144_1118 [Fodinibius roseus]|uniref:Uncharacterized protein n=1 Tax=Fodinibius roseus TaxID=1194090 RepID=A0A1M5D6B4_9BACT|nr:hypothetical protein SAMN05443144_1118 [Fodinibius roseus]